ncbi:MAG: bifunctional (p)ppGpp synthetase/guanosine-3',5'-bis(diphosphate) 3'-pyrophosphohydrolase [Betaproteobacteria bacterium]|nr:bifunctional (p)ppGpp synthetase/guanosine-3',5'-bis(diphosphate) 3'-pyrophosphohydrolase [Betaproteobacteria bacterium]
MKTGAAAVPAGAAAIVHLASGGEPLEADPVRRARAFAEPLLAGQALDTGEEALAHADGTAAVLRQIGGGPSLCAAAYLVYAGDYLQRPEEVVSKAFGASYASLVTLTRKLVQIQRAARAAQPVAGAQGLQTERVRKMLLAFSRDLRVVLLRLASRLQTLRWFAATRQPCPLPLATESLQVFAPLANRLGIWQIKWEMEDLAFRYLQPRDYQRIAGLVDERRAERETGVAAVREQLATLLAAAGLHADVQGRPKHLYSIWKKMQGKHLPFERVLDTRALRVIVDDVPACYMALARVHETWAPIDGEFDDYIARPKLNGYQSLHTVVRGEDGRPLEVQIRTRAMHEHAEHGVAAHWMYKEAGAKGYAGVSTVGENEERVAEARKAVLRELLAWERDFAAQDSAGGAPAQAVDAGERIYVFTPQATIIDLPAGGTPVDFAYALHTDLGHRCRGARVDGVMVPLNTRLLSGQTVEVVAAKEGGPSLDWLNAELHYLASPRSKSKVRAWFNAEQQAQTIARGREAVEKLLQRTGRTAMERQALAEQLGFKSADALFEVVGKDEFSLRNIENLLRPPEPPPDDDQVLLHAPRSGGGGSRGGVLVVGMDSLLTTLGKCCRPAPPDAITGFVTRGRGVAVHRSDCSNFRQMAQSAPGRVIEVTWGQPRGDKAPVYPLDVVIEAADRGGLLRDISEVFAKEKVNVTGVHTQSAKDGSTAWMTFTVEVTDTARLGVVLGQIKRVAGVRHARRK